MKQMSFSDAEVKPLNAGFSTASLDSNAKINHNLKWNSSAYSNPLPKVDGNKQFLSKDLHYLKNAELESQLKLLVGRERQLLHLILKHIQEVDRRKLYAARAFSSLFEYLTKAMGYSFAAAQRRIEAARMMNQVPELALQIQKGDVNLSQIGVISHAVKLKESQTGKKLSAEVKREVIATVAQKTTAQTQVLVAEKLDLPLQQPERKTMQKDQSCVLSITLSPEQQAKLQRCHELLAAKMQQEKKSHTTVNYLEELMDFYLSKKDPCLEKNRPRNSSDKVSKENQSSKMSTWTSDSTPLASLTSEKENSNPSSLYKMKKISLCSISEMENLSSSFVSKVEVGNHSGIKMEATSEKEKDQAISSKKTVKNHAIYLEEIANINSASDAKITKQKSKGRQPSLKKQIFQKWKDCQFHDPLTGRKCGEKFQLEMEHLQPRWAGGKDCIENRTLLCRTHNHWKYRQQAGLH